MKVAYWTIHGRSNPIWCRNASICSGFIPRTFSSRGVGSPFRYSTPYEITVMHTTATAAWARRRAMYRVRLLSALRRGRQDELVGQRIPVHALAQPVVVDL